MQFLSSFMLYAIASGLNRGAVFLIMPLLAYSLNGKDYGELSLFFVSSQLLIPLITLNFSSVIARDIYEKKQSVTASLLSFNCILLFSFIILILLYSFFYSKYILLFCYAVIESFFIINSTYIRYTKGAYSFVKVTFVKFSVLVAFFIMAYVFDRSLLSSYNFIVFVFIISTATSVIFFWRFFHILMIKKSLLYLVKNSGLLTFGIFLLPHVFSQWAISGLDKYVIKLNYSPEILGVYAFGYSIASLYMLVNSSLALYIPQICLKSNDNFKSDRFYFIYFILVTLIFTSFLMFGFVFFIYYDGQFSGDNLFNEVFIPVSFGLYMMSFYYYYNSVVFFERNVKFINNTTFFVSIITAICLLLFVPKFGFMAASWITMYSYLLYFVIFSFKCRTMGIWRIYIPISMLFVFYFVLNVFLN